MFFNGIGLLIYIGYGMFAGAGLCCLIFSYAGPFQMRARLLIAGLGAVLVLIPVGMFVSALLTTGTDGGSN